MFSSLFSFLGGIFSAIGSVLGFLLTNFHIIIGIALILFLIGWLKECHGKYQGASYVILAGLVIHTVILWNVSPEDGRIMLIITRCLVPALLSFFISIVLDEHPVASYVVSLGIYIVLIVLTILFSNVLVPIITGIVLFPIAWLGISIFGGQARMDMESSSPYGDSEVVQQLHKQGFKPSGSYGDAQQQEKANQDLLQHGVNPYKDKNK